MIITICGSQNSEFFIDEMKKAQELLQKKGHEVHVPDSFGKDFLVTEEFYQNSKGREKFLAMKPLWTVAQGKKIENSDAVLIMNHEKNGIKGYIGSNTLMELTIALYFGKKIYFLYPIDEKHPHFEELIGINLVVLNGDLDKLV